MIFFSKKMYAVTMSVLVTFSIFAQQKDLKKNDFKVIVNHLYNHSRWIYHPEVRGEAVTFFPKQSNLALVRDWEGIFLVDIEKKMILKTFEVGKGILGAAAIFPDEKSIIIEVFCHENDCKKQKFWIYDIENEYKSLKTFTGRTGKEIDWSEYWVCNSNKIKFMSNNKIFVRHECGADIYDYINDKHIKESQIQL